VNLRNLYRHQSGGQEGIFFYFKYIIVVIVDTLGNFCQILIEK